MNDILIQYVHMKYTNICIYIYMYIHKLYTYIVYMYTHASSFFQVMPEFSFHACQRGPFHQEQRDAEAQKREYADSRPRGEIRLVGKTVSTVDGSEIWRENHGRCKKNL